MASERELFWYAAAKTAWRHRTFGLRFDLTTPGGYRYDVAFGGRRDDGSERVFYGPAARRNAARDRATWWRS